MKKSISMIPLSLNASAQTYIFNIPTERNTILSFKIIYDK